MTSLPAAQLRRLNHAILVLNEEIAGPQPLEAIVDLIDSLLPVPWITVDEVELATGRMEHRSSRRLEHVPQLKEAIARYCDQNPLVAYALAGNFAPALRVSDFRTFREIKTTGFYQEIVRHFTGWRDQVAVPIQLPGTSLGFTLNRDKKFSDEELLLLELFQPHLERVLRRSTQYLHLATEKPLTPREREVLHWVAERKRDSETALILGTSVRTVEQHVRVCLRKLGVETRSGAAAALWRARSRPPGTAQFSEIE